MYSCAGCSILASTPGARRRTAGGAVLVARTGQLEADKVEPPDLSITLSSQGAHTGLSIAPPCAQTSAEMQGQDTVGVSLLLLLSLLSVYMLSPAR